MLIGMALGFVVGLLPGLGGPTTLALMLPFVFKMTPIEAFAFLLGMLAVTATTGDITSILFGVPGEPTTAATIVDGHAMAKNGEAGRALGAAMMSSLIGAVFGALVLGLAIPVVRPLVLTLGSPEFFMLALLGITFVASLSGEALVKGLLAGGLRLWLATIGLDPVTGIQRYTFGQLFLWDGIGLVPVTIGFYAIPELIEMANAGSSIAKLDVGRVGGVWEGVRDTFRHWLLVIRCSALGTFISIIPGLGAATTQWLAYAHAVQSSSGRERFGKGAVEGVLLAFGALGWAMSKLDWPRPPLLLGLVLGPLAENRLFLSTDNYGAAWLLRPGVLIIAAVMAAGLIVPIVSQRRNRPTAAPTEVSTGARGWGLDGATAFNLGLVLLFAAALWMSRRFDVRAGLFPWTITAAALTLAIVHAASELTRRRNNASASEGSQGTASDRRRTVAICAWILGMYAAIWLLGFSLATLITTVLYLRIARERWPLSVGLSLVGFAFVYGLFEKGLGVPFPPGQLFVWLGYGG